MGDDTPEQHHWCPKQEQLLIRWAEKAAGYRWLHNHARMFYKKQNDWLSYPCKLYQVLRVLVVLQY